MLRDYTRQMIELWRSQNPYRAFNADLINMYEGELEQYLDKALRARLSQQAYEQAVSELSPINILTKMMDKVSTTYNQPPTRTVQLGNESDQQLVDWYSKAMMINKKLQKADTFLNMFRCCLIQPYYSQNEQTPAIRIIPNDRFVVYSDDQENELNPTHIMVSAGMINNVQTFYLYSKDEILWMDENENILPMQDNPNNVNPIGRLPFVYVNQSGSFLTPKKAEDLFRMTILIPMLLTDLSVAIKFQAFSILYGIDVDAQNLKYAPNVFWNFKSDASTDKTPSIGTIKPEVDITEVYNFAIGVLSTWMSTRSIRANGIGQADSSNLASGLAKLIDDADTTEFKTKQKGYFKEAETELWDLILHYFHPYWLSTQADILNTMFTPLASVITEFVDDIPLNNRGTLVADLKAEVDAKFTTRKKAIQTLNPYMTSSQVDEYMIEIDEEHTTEITVDEPQEQVVADNVPTQEPIENLEDDE